VTSTKQAVAYFRTSSATNVGENKDSLKRQQSAVHAYAKTRRLEVIKEFYDAAVSGADPVQSRDGFNDMLAYLLSNGARIVLVESASRFARDLVVQITGHALLKKHGIELIPVDAPGHFTEDTPTATMVRAVLGAVSEFEKNTLVARLRKARDRKSVDLGRRIEGRKDWLPVPEAAVKAAKAAAARRSKPSLRAIAKQLEAKGFLSPSGKAYGAGSIQRMLTKK
jgi:DNA invertase Pin-like site-specific DNA recombinase